MKVKMTNYNNVESALDYLREIADDTVESESDRMRCSLNLDQLYLMINVPMGGGKGYFDD